MAQVMSYGEPTLKPGQSYQRFTATDAAADDSDKTITVPAKQTWEIGNIFATLVTTGDAGNRQISVIITDPAGVALGNLKADSVQVASTTEYYNASPAAGIAVEGPAGYHFMTLPAFVLDTGCTIRVYDSAAIQPAADDLTVTITGRMYH